MKQMRIKHNENGRSMVEMLGVLAVVGVLSIGGVAGYRYAVDKMNANEIINELKKRAITASQQRVLGQDINLAEYGDRALIKGTYSVSPISDYNGNASQFALAVAGVPERVCDMILESDWALPTAMAVNGGSCVEGANGNTMTFAFNNTLESGAVGNGNNGGNGDEGNDTPSDEPIIEPCGENEYRLADGSCQLDTNCSDPNQFWNPRADGWNGACVSCPTEGNPVKNDGSDMEDSCTKCSGAYNGYFGVNGSSAVSYCVYCPSGIVCGDKCCGEDQGCQIAGDEWNPSYSCITKSCLNDNDCAGKVTNNSSTGREICDTFTGQCVWGCKDNRDCSSNQFCNFNEERKRYACDSPKYGTCELATINGSFSFYGKTLYPSDNTVGPWSAKNFCDALNMNQFNINLKDYCTNEEWQDILKNNMGSCGALKINSDQSNYWTAIARGTCDMHRISFYNGGLYPNAGVYALCEGEGEYVPPVVSTEVTTQTETTTTTATETASGGPQICGTNGNCYNCSDYDAGNYGIEVNNQSDCSVCDETGHQWVAVYFSNASRLACRACKDPYFSDIEDHIEESCDKCGFGVDWSVAHGSYDNHLWYSCAPTSEDIGTKPNS